MWCSISSSKTTNQQIPLEESSLIIVQGNSLETSRVVSPYLALNGVLGDLISDEAGSYLLRSKYPEIADLLDCMWSKESTRGVNKNIKGDNGLAYGDFQIHIDKHPIGYNCAMDFECSLDYTAKMVKDGYGYLWTSYQKCGGI